MSKKHFKQTVTFYGDDREDFVACIEDVVDMATDGWNVKADWGTFEEIDPSENPFYDGDEEDDGEGSLDIVEVWCPDCGTTQELESTETLPDFVNLFLACGHARILSR